METASRHLTDTILNLTLEIIHLLTGEDCLVVSGSGECLVGRSCPRASRKSIRNVSPARRERNHDLKILEVTHKIIELLTREVPIRCQDVAVYLSMEEREYLEGHKELYEAAMMEDQPLGSSHSPKEDSLSLPHLAPKPTNHSSDKFGEPPSMEEGGHSRNSSVSLSTYLKEEPFPRADESLPCDGLDLDTADGDYAATHIKAESGDIMDTYAAGEDLQFVSIHGMEESGSCEEANEEDLDCYISMTPPRLPTGIINSSAGYRNLNWPISAACDADDDPPLICSECGKCFSNSSTLIQHQATHLGKSAYPCPECGKRFDKRAYLIAHLDTHVRGEAFAEKGHQARKPYICTVCGKVFSNNSNRVRHQKIHTGEKPFSCAVCGKSFRRKTHLTIHGRVHTGERPFRCQECGKCFSCSAHLVAHRRIHTREAVFLL